LTNHGAFSIPRIKLYQGDAKAFLDTAMQGFFPDQHDCRQDFVDSLRLLLPAATNCRD